MARSVTAIENIIAELVKILNKDLYLGALTNVSEEVCFDCTLWNTGYIDNTDPDNPVTVIPPIKTSILTALTSISTFLEDQLKLETITDYGFKTQLERLLTMVNDLSNKINSIQCNTTCSDIGIMAQLLSTIVLSLTQLLSVLELLNGLLSYMGTCGCIGTKLFDILMGKFINAITSLQCPIQDWYGLVMVFFQYSAMPAKGYVASYMPNQPITPPPMPGPMQHACVPCPPRPQAPNCGCNLNNNCTQYPMC